MIATVMYR